jgi:hypothetical protein
MRAPTCVGSVALMLYVFGYDRVAIVLADLYFLDPNPAPGQEGAERGVRIELRRLELGAVQGSIYAARPIGIDAPIWRVDMLERVDGPVGSFDRTHHHPRCVDWEPNRRVFDPDLSADPIGWFEHRLQHIESVLDDAGVDRSELGPNDPDDISTAAPEIVATLRSLLQRVHEGSLAVAPKETVDAARVSWL